MELKKELENIKAELSENKALEPIKGLVVKEEQKVLPKQDTQIISMIENQERELIGTQHIKELGRRFGEERIKSDLKAEASRIRRKNIETAENEFENETRELRLKHLKAELDLEHKYNMETLGQTAKHSQMLDKRKKLVEKYSYLYDCSADKCYKATDSKGVEFLVPKDFSFSKIVNVMRQFGRNVSKLDKPILQTLKWFLIIGVGVSAILILKNLGII